MTSPHSLAFKRLDAEAARRSSTTIEDLYVRSHQDAIKSGDPFRSTATFMERFDRYTKTPGFDLLVAYEEGDPIGLTWGWPLRPNSTWWDGLLTDLGTGFTEESGQRTFALSEIMVVSERMGRGVAHALHDELLAARQEERATLLVRPDNERAYTAYRRWGWQRVGSLRPAWPDAPTFDVLIHALPVDLPPGHGEIRTLPG